MDALIVTADDLALSPQVTAGITDACRYGVVTTASLLVYSPWAGEAVAQGRDVGLAIGLHLDLVSPFAEMRSGQFGPQGWFCCELLGREYEHHIGKLFSCEELIAIRDEMHRQIDEFARLAGRLPSHLDYHFGLHHCGEVMALYLTVAEQFGLPVRWGKQYAGPNPYHLAPECLCDGFRGIEGDGVARFLGAVDLPCDGVKEMICHPGYTTPGLLPDSYNHERELELRALIDPRLKEGLARRGVRLVTYDWLREHLTGR